MKNLNKVLLVLSGFGSLVLFTACGNSTTSSQATTTCPAGQTVVGTVCQVTTTTTTAQSAQSCPANYAWSANLSECVLQNTSCGGNNGINPVSGQCVSLGGTASATANHSPYQGSCQYGYIQTQAGCLAPGACSATPGYGFGYWGGYPYCFQATVSQ